MINIGTADLQSICIHQIGSKNENEGIFLSDKAFDCKDPDLRDMLLRYFVGGFKEPDFYSFTFSNGDANMNPIFQYASAIFDNPDLLYNQSIFIAQHLYENSSHPNIKPGDLMICYLQSIVVEEEVVDAIGIFKSEDKDAFLKLYKEEKEMKIMSDEGISINKIDKACLILKTEKDNGYKLCIKDHLNKNKEAHYWKNDFLQVIERNDDYHATKNYIELTKSFVKDRLQPLYDIDKTEEAGILHRSKEFFKKVERFEEEEYADRVFFENDKVIDAFKEFREEVNKERITPLEATFFVSNSAVKKHAKYFRSVLKLDKNFHIYIHGNHDLIEKGKDDKGKYYKVYFEEES